MRCAIVFGLVSSLISPGFSQGSSSATTTFNDSVTISVVEAINRNQLSTADEIINSQLKLDSTSLKWLFFRGIRHYADLFVVSSVNKEALRRMKQDMQKIQQLGERALQNNPKDPVALFYVGGAYGYLGIAESFDGSLFSGVGRAKKGFNMHEKLIKQCPDCYDAYLGPGLMNLLTSAAPWILKPILWIFGLSGTEEKAHEYLTIAYEKGTLVRLEAGTYLAQLYERKKDFRRAYELYGRLIERYPMRVGLRAESFSPLWHDKRYDDIIASAQKMMTVFESRQYSFTSSDSSWTPMVVHSLSLAYKLKGDTLSAVRTMEDFLEKPEYLSIDKWRISLSLGDFYSENKETPKAIAHYRTVMASNAPSSVKKRVADTIEEYTKLR